MCPSVCLSQVGIVSKPLNEKSRKQRRTKTQDSSLLLPKISAKFDSSHPLRDAKCRGKGKNRRLSTMTRYILKTVQDRRIVAIKIE